MKNLTDLPALTAAAPTAMARWVLPLPVFPWKTKSWHASMKASDLRSASP